MPSSKMTLTPTVEVALLTSTLKTPRACPKAVPHHCMHRRATANPCTWQEEIRSTHPVAVHLKGDRSEDHPDVVDRRDVSVAEQVVQVDAAGAGDAPSEDQRAPTAPSERPRNEDVTLVTDLHVMDLHVDDPTIPRIEATLTSSSFTPIPITSYLSASAFCVIVLASGALIALVVTGAHVWITEVADVDV
eukprot:TRINITY_DN29252_c0_g1_i1.p1 TRINITY_DN29252_c0_g1~~TRINITY_DN29252_c0_g1_i1.p1  ORF type:complete len:190 (-),score=27.43 TRINITY_DN29252_c0_g1_i1:200-769(-)